MRTAREAVTGFLLAGLFVAIILGGVALSLAESNIRPVTVPPTQPATDTPALPTSTVPPSQTSIFTETASPTSTDTTTPPPPPTTCPPPVGWVSVIVQPGDTLYTLAFRYGITPETLSQQNCLLTADLPAGSRVYVPFVSTVVPTPCRPPSSWVIYIVQPGDNLFRISLKYRITVAQLQRGNCMGSSYLIYSGQRLYVPNVATSTPNVTNTPTSTGTPTPSITPSNTATSTPTLATPTNTLVPTDTPTPSDTPVLPTPTPTSTQ
jgi:LysM repeat protein